MPDKLYYSIGEVSKITGVKPHVLRYWESEFPSLAPIRSQRRERGQRKYRKQDIELILRIKNLLYKEAFTIEGAKKKLNKKSSDESRDKKLHLEKTLAQIKEQLIEIKRLLDSGRGAAW